MNYDSLATTRGRKALIRHLHDWRWMTGMIALAALGACVPVNEVHDRGNDSFDFPCVVGDVTPHEAVVWLKTKEAQAVKVQYTTDSRWMDFQETSLIQTNPEEDFTAHMLLTSLNPKTRYLYRGVVPGKFQGPTCQFITAPLAEDGEAVTFVIGGDTRHSFQPFSIMEAMRQEHPDFFVFLGDTIYADKETPARELQDYWHKYVENRDGFAERLFANTSVYAMWDDHEVDSDFISTHPLMPIGRRAFFDYWPIRRQDSDPDRLFRTFQWGKAVELFLLDTRQYRNPTTKTMLGAVQKTWLLDRLLASTARFKFIVSSVPFSDPRPDKWGEYPDERDEILRFISNHNITGVVFLAGDVHHAAVSRLPGLPDRKEFIFGPLAGPMNYKISRQEPRFEFFHEHLPNYGKVTVPAGETAPVQVEWFDEHHTLLHQVMVHDERSVALNSKEN